MKEENQSAWRQFLKYVWLPFATFMTAVDLIQIGDNIWPTIIKWSNFFQFWIEFIRQLRDIVFLPFNWINIYVPTSLKDYLLFGFFLTNSFLSTTEIYTSIFKEKKFSDLVRVEMFLLHFFMLCFWPLIYIYLCINYLSLISLPKEFEYYGEHEAVNRFNILTKIIGRAILLSIFLVFINYTFNQI